MQGISPAANGQEASSQPAAPEGEQDKAAKKHRKKKRKRNSSGVAVGVPADTTAPADGAPQAKKARKKKDKDGTAKHHCSKSGKAKDSGVVACSAQQAA